ncbi:MAG: ankyrin repeat domain-containing protein [Candidatus Omnitrophica bacterium]|nr:ankyrin repeat domain-containing protein [Candidatus Omnitrophota bacterium]
MTNQKTIKVWLDAYKPAPKGWTRAKTQEKAITLLKTGRVETVSLYHDSGPNKQSGIKPTGHNLILGYIKKKICEGNFQPPLIEIWGFHGGILDYRLQKLTPAQKMLEQIENIWFEKELSLAKKNNDSEKMNLLINAGVHIGGSKDSPSSIPPLITFSARGCSRIVKLLIDAGADNQKIYRKWKWTALDFAVWNDRAETAEILRSAGLKESSPIAKNAGLISAIEKNDLEKAAFWLKSGADVNAQDPLGHPCLLLAARKRNRAKLVKLLVNAGAEVNARRYYLSREGKQVWSDTALMYAVQSGCTSIVKILINSGADVKLECRGRTALEEAARDGHYIVVKMLIAAGADVNATDDIPIINIAAWNGYAKIVKVLRAAGAKDDDRTKELEKMGRLIKAVKDGNTAEVNRLILSGADVNIKDRCNWPLIMHAAGYGHAAIVKLLIAAGADVNARDENYPLTASIVAGGKDWRKIVRMLRKAGAKELERGTWNWVEKK